jgi:general secretion pathway protein G
MLISPMNSHPARDSHSGFTLVELLIVVAIIGIIAAIAIPNLLSAIQRGKQKRTMGDIKTVGTALESFDTDASSYPNSAFVALSATTYPYGASCSTCLNPDFMASPIFKDGWYSNLNSAAVLQYKATATDGYLLCSLGKNTATDGNASCATGSLPYTGNAVDGSTFDCDISFSNGQFIQGPLGKQKNTTGC